MSSISYVTNEKVHLKNAIDNTSSLYIHISSERVGTFLFVESNNKETNVDSNF
jgi:hypothetical protein